MLEIVSYGGWERCGRLVSGQIEIIITLDVGPRIIRLGVIGGPNEFVEYPDQMGQKGGTAYQSYGGHRLWVAPEIEEITCEPDNDPVSVFEEDGWFCFRKAPGNVPLTREIRIKPQGGSFAVDHVVTNTSDTTTLLAVWCLSVMAAGGECLWPMPRYVSHKLRVLPAAPLVLWHYTDLTDPRWSLGPRVGRLRQTAAETPQKIGAFVADGLAVYANHGNVFVKRFDAQQGAEYLDHGCNFETYTRHDMLEVESLGPQVVLDPGESTSHAETWWLLQGETPPLADAEAGIWLTDLASRCPAANLES